MAELEVGGKFKLSLERSFGGYIQLDNVTLSGTLDLTVAMTIDNIKDQFEEIAHTLPNHLKVIDLSKEVWLYFTTFESKEKIIIPKSFVLQHTVVSLTTIKKTLEISVTSNEQYRDLINYLTDYGINYDEI